MKIKVLKEEHPAIYKRALECQVEQGNEPNDELTLFANKKQGNFDWSETSESGTFWDSISYGKFQVFYNWYPKHSKQPVTVEEKDWSKATDEELIAEAKRRYPKGTVITDANEGYNAGQVIGGWSMRRSDVYVDTETGLTYAFCKYSDGFKWAEIVSQPQLNGKVPFVSMDECEVEFRTISELAPEPKVGDMVEVNDVIGICKILHIKGDWMWIESADGLDDHYIVRKDRIRLPQKSEVESKANDLSQQWYHLSGDGKTNMIELFKQAIKWGQQNPNAK